jgi:hypothetical protein
MVQAEAPDQCRSKVAAPFGRDDDQERKQAQQGQRRELDRTVHELHGVQPGPDLGGGRDAEAFRDPLLELMKFDEVLVEQRPAILGQPTFRAVQPSCRGSRLGGSRLRWHRGVIAG